MLRSYQECLNCEFTTCTDINHCNKEKKLAGQNTKCVNECSDCEHVGYESAHVQYESWNVPVNIKGIYWLMAHSNDKEILERFKKYV